MTKITNKILASIPKGYKLNIDDYKGTHECNLCITCPKGHVNTAETWNKLRLWIHQKREICKTCYERPVQRSTLEYYNDMATKCLLQGVVILTPFEKYYSRDVKLTIQCVANSHVENNVSCESIMNHRSHMCSQCRYGHVKGGAIPRCACGGTCLTCKVRSGFRYIKHSISMQNYPGNIDFKWVVRQFHKQKGQCCYSRLEMDPTGRNRAQALSIDRLDNSKPHDRDNCVLVTLPVNLGKNRMNDEEFQQWLDLVFEHRGGTRGAVTAEERYHIQRTLNCGMRNNSNRTRRARVDCNLTLDELVQFCNDHPTCAVTDVPVVWESKAWNSGSFDRIDNSRGYSLDNIQVVLRNINYMRSNILTTDQCRELMTTLL